MVRFTLPGILSTALLALPVQPGAASPACVGHLAVRVLDQPEVRLAEPGFCIAQPYPVDCHTEGADLASTGAVTLWVCSPTP
jgi:hypothetical protein